MKICIINHSDTLGGASIVSYRLMHALRSLGHDAYMLVMHKESDDPFVFAAASKLRCDIPFFVEHLRLFRACGFSKKNIFKISSATDGLPLSRHPLVLRSDAVIINWINQGMLSLDEIARISRLKPTVWVMHDMWNLTALCHHAGLCPQFASEPSCTACPLISLPRFGVDVWMRKNKLYTFSHICFSAVSSWLRNRCKESVLMRDIDVGVIPNPFPIEEFYLKPRKSRGVLGLPDGKKLVVMGASRLDDPIKGFDFLPQIFSEIKRDDYALVLFGNIKERTVLQRLNDINIPTIWLGTINTDDVKELFSHSDVVMSTSRYETLPGTIIEGMAAGCTPVAFNSGGQSDIISDQSLGYLIEPYDKNAFATAVSSALDSPISRDLLHEHINNKFSDEVVARRYLELISNML